MGLSRRERVTGAVVVLVRETDPSRLVVTATNRDGVFVVEGIPEGRYRILVTREGLRPAVVQSVEVRGPFRAEADIIVQKGEGPAPVVDLSPPPPMTGATSSTGARVFVADGMIPGAGEAVVRLRAYGPGGAPQEGARFQMRRTGGGADPLTGETGKDGELELPRPPPGEYSLKIECAGQLTLRVDRLVIADAPLAIEAFMVARPPDYRGTPADLLPEEKPLPPPEIAPQPEPPQGPAPTPAPG